MVFPSLLLAMMMSATHSQHTARTGSYGEAKYSHYTVHGLILPSNRTAAYKETEKKRTNYEHGQIQFLLSLPSVELSQKQELAVCRPAPFFCMITHVTEWGREKRWLHKPIFKGNVNFHGLPMYLNGFCNFVSWLRHCSTTLDVHWFTLLFW